MNKNDLKRYRQSYKIRPSMFIFKLLESKIYGNDTLSNTLLEYTLRAEQKTIEKAIGTDKPFNSKCLNRYL